MSRPEHYGLHSTSREQEFDSKYCLLCMLLLFMFRMHEFLKSMFAQSVNVINSYLITLNTSTLSSSCDFHTTKKQER